MIIIKGDDQIAKRQTFLTKNTKQKLQTLTHRLPNCTQHLWIVNQLVHRRFLIGIDAQIDRLAGPQSTLEPIGDKVAQQFQLIDIIAIIKEDRKVTLFR